MSERVGRVFPAWHLEEDGLFFIFGRHNPDGRYTLSETDAGVEKSVRIPKGWTLVTTASLERHEREFSDTKRAIDTMTELAVWKSADEGRFFDFGFTDKELAWARLSDLHAREIELFGTDILSAVARALDYWKNSPYSIVEHEPQEPEKPPL